MNEALIKNWNAAVKPDDEIWNLGDFSFASLKEIMVFLRRLNGKINMVLGNHDKPILQSQKKLIEDKLLNSVQYYKELKINNQLIVLSHYPFRSWNGMHRGSIHCHGHCHSNLLPFGKSVDVGVDCKEITDEYRPVSLDEVLSYMSKRSSEIVDHHGVKK
jgi:calcineurin-like phosphoesterase family protein